MHKRSLESLLGPTKSEFNSTGSTGSTGLFCSKLRVLHRDENLIAVDKPAGMIVHRGWDKDPVTVADIVRDKIVGHQVFAVHRLDRGTSGVLLFALNKESARKMQDLFNCGGVIKKYIALVRGHLKEEIFVDHPIKQREKDDRIDARTRFIPVEIFERCSLVEAYPETGRQHQIRRHLKHLSHPIVGDVRYGKGDVNRHFRETFGFARMALHAESLHVDGLKIESPFEGFF